MSLFLRSSSRTARQLRNFSKFSSISLSRKPQENRIFTTTQQPQVSHNVTRYLHLTLRDLEKVTVNCPGFADSITEGDITFEKNVGDAFDADDVLAEIETDKTTIPVPAPISGVVLELLVEDGSTVNPGNPLMILDTEGGAPAVKETPEVASEPPKEAPAPSEPTPEPRKVIPTTLPPVPSIPTEPLTTTKSADVKITPMSPPSGEIIGSRAEHRVKMNRMRQRIATRLKDAQNTAAMLTTFNEVDMSTLMALRSNHKEAFFKRHGVKLSFMSAFIKASTYALQEQPVVNAVIDDATSEIVYRDFVDISVAVSTNKGLVVPVIRNCETMNYLDIEQEMTSLATRARNNELTVEDMDGGTFTISNGGVFGSMFGTPIINLPQSSILGMHGIFDRPVAVDNQVVIRPMMYVALTYDHRLVDGREAVSFLKKIKEGVEDPTIFLLGM